MCEISLKLYFYVVDASMLVRISNDETIPQEVL